MFMRMNQPSKDLVVAKSLHGVRETAKDPTPVLRGQGTLANRLRGAGSIGIRFIVAE
jgi:hypothetical protein